MNHWQPAKLFSALMCLLSIVFPFSRSMAAEYPNADLLIETGQLARHLDDAALRIIDVRSAKAYASGHIPNAVHLGADDIIDAHSQVEGGLLPATQLATILGELGIDRDTKVVLYDDKGGFHAARLFWMLEYFGHRGASILNGGITKWSEEGRSLTASTPSVQGKIFGLTPTPRRLATADWLMERNDASSVAVIDVRPSKAYAAGHIPWAINIPWKQNLKTDGTLKSAQDLRAHFASQGITPDKKVVVHCQNGKAASHSYFALRLLGYPQIRTYDRSWAEWGKAGDLPIQVGR
jgi:thiosulfate/3-mercaptopyruvate sulfurtransferase